MATKDNTRSVANIPLKSGVDAVSVTPQGGSKTLALRLSREEAQKLSRNLSVAALSGDCGDITVTIWKQRGRIVVMSEDLMPKRLKGERTTNGKL